MKIAVIGAGQMGQHHVRVCNQLEELDLVGVVDADAERRERAARLHGATGYASLEALLNDATPEAVVIALPTTLHHSVGVAALEAGLHVLVEKPIAASAEEGLALTEAASSSGRVLAVGHVERFNPALDRLRQLLQEETLGRLYKVQARRFGPFPPRIQDVGVTVDLATHDIDVMRWLVGRPVTRVFAETARKLHSAHEDLLAATIRFDDETIGVLDVNWLTPTKVRELTVQGERGMFTVDYLRQELTFHENSSLEASAEQYRIMGMTEGKVIGYPIRRVEPLAAELMQFARACSGDEPARVTGADGLAALKIAEALIRSGREHSVVDLVGA